MAEHFRGTGHVLRLIEYMDVGNSNGWRMDDVVPAARLLEEIDARWPLEPIEPAYPGEVATRYRYLDGAGEIGIIASVTQPFCGDCTRARLSADGKLYTCLFAAAGHDLRDAALDGRRRPARRARRRHLARPRRSLLGAAQRAHPAHAPGRDVAYWRVMSAPAHAGPGCRAMHYDSAFHGTARRRGPKR